MNAAVFVDFENLYLSLKNRDDCSNLRTRELCLQILQGLSRRLRDEGSPMVMGRSYSAFDTYPGVEVAHDLALLGLEPQYVIVSHSGKNSADIQLALDVARVLFRRPDIQMIVIVSGDRDFIPLARQVLEEGRGLRVVAIPDTTSADLRDRVGHERYWNALDLIEGKRSMITPSATARGVRSAPAPVEARSEPVAAAEAAADAAPAAATKVEEQGGAAAEVAAAEVAAAEAAKAEGPGAEAEGGAPGGSSNGVGVHAGQSALDDEDEHPHDGPVIVGHVPVTWSVRGSGGSSPEQLEERLATCMDLLLRARSRHGSEDIWLSPFLKGPMSQTFSHLVHPERRALINELRNRGAIGVEERENQYADHPYSVVVINDAHPMAQAAWSRAQRRG
jgi:hypothetical protein